MRLERKTESLLPTGAFLFRLTRYALFGGGLIFGSLLLGTLGYRWLADLAWVDALLNASFILTGMGPIDPMRTTAAKLFATAYALFSGVVFLTSVAVIMTPAVHRLLHRFHVTGEEDGDFERRN